MEAFQGRKAIGLLTARAEVRGLRRQSRISCFKGGRRVEGYSDQASGSEHRRAKIREVRTGKQA